jgi:hypothetical protein
MNDGIAIGGVDLDTCRMPDVSIEPWASEIIERFTSYTEISPSSTGVKVFFRYRVAALPELRAAMAPAKHGREFKRGGGDHPPAIELHLSNRFFAVTGQRLDGTPEALAIVDKEILLWLLHEAGPAFVRSTSDARPRSGGADNSRSAIAFRKGLEMRRAGASFKEFCAALRADPATADWYTEKGIAADGRQLKRIWERAGAKGHAAQRTITVHAGERHQAADAGLAALQAAGTPFYQRGRTLVRVCEVKARSTSGEVIFVPGIAEVTPAILDRALGQAARWERFDPKRQEMVRIDPPRAVVAQILDMVGEWPFPALAGVIGCPTLRPDGSLLNGEGYDEATGLVLRCSIPLPLLSDRPSRQAAEAAATLLLDLLAEFPFADETSKSVALSMLLTPVLRGAMTAAPMHLVTAPQPGTGKSYLADVAAMIATGERVAAVAVAPNPEETEKRLVGSALAGFPIIGLDNCRDTLAGDFLCQVTERPLLQLRALGKSDKIRVANTFTTYANGNNVAVADDLVRRTIRCTLDANLENPECRTFRGDPLAAVRRDRGAYIAAALTIARAYIAAGKPGRLPPLPSYEGWSDLVRSPLKWLGYADPVDT